MKKYISGAMALVLLCAFMFAGASLAESKKINVVTTIFPIYDWTRQVAGENEAVEITLLLDDGVDLHSYQPTVQDLMKVAGCDLFVYVGGESDEWAAQALSATANPGREVLSLMEAMGAAVKAEERVEGMELEKESDGDEAEYDEHIWLSLRNAQTLVKAIAGALGEADPEGEEAYAANAAAYCEVLAALDAEYAAAVEAAEIDTLLFGDRFPFRYLADDYGLSYYAAFSGCSAESEASFETVVFLAGKVDALALPAVLTIEGTNRRVAETVVENTRAKDAAVLTLDSMQGAPAADATYLGVMRDNLETLKRALAR